METTKINCPKCNHEFNVEDVLSQRLEAKYLQQFNDKSSALKRQMDEQERQIKEKERQIEEKERQIEEKEHLIEEKVKAAAATKEVEIRKKINAEYETKIKSLSDAEKEANEKLVRLKNTELENERLKRLMNSQRQDIELEFERKMTDQLKEETDVIRRREKESSALKIEELKKQLEDQKKLAEEMKRKAEQGSMQLQGEIQEIEIEEMLRDLYEREGDEIVEIKKGQHGADILHHVKTRTGEMCGKIYYESKRTKDFNNSWLQKLRDDNLEIKADTLVLVTETMPAGQNRFFIKDGVWICSLWEVKGLSLALRHGIMRIHAVSVVHHGKETKTEMLYNYLTSQEFAGQFNAIIEGFTTLQTNQMSERRSMEKIWKEREKQLEKILANTARFYGSIKGIAGQVIPTVPLLEIESAQGLLEN
ncbi:MAG: DUF2130 domain-containing protein [Thermoguttaceae bacterium]